MEQMCVWGGGVWGRELEICWGGKSQVTPPSLQNTGYFVYVGLQLFFHMSKCITIHIDYGNCVTSSVYRYLDLGGSEERGMRALAASYVGLPNMVNAMI